jgi:hypothetical protein
VVPQIEHELVYTEVKSSPPKHIDQRDVASFFERIADMAPHAAVFFVDIELRMTEKNRALIRGGAPGPLREDEPEEVPGGAVAQ